MFNFHMPSATADAIAAAVVGRSNRVLNSKKKKKKKIEDFSLKMAFVKHTPQKNEQKKRVLIDLCLWL